MSDEFDPIDTRQRDEAKEASDKLLALAIQKQNEDFLWLMNDKRGRRLVWRWLAEAGTFQQTFNPDAMLMSFAEGRRSAGLRLLAQVHTVCPELYTTMMKEQQP